MKVPENIARKAAEYETARDKAYKLYGELSAWCEENGFADFYIDEVGIAKEPKGVEQGEGEYCDQVMDSEDTGHGTYYYPIEGSTQFMYVDYSFF